jgi:protein-tyrosine phosphatase
VIDLHCHLLPKIDDGSKNLEESLEMARIAVADGIRITACTPHIMPGVYDNTGPAIEAAVVAMQAELDKAGIPLLLVPGADVHIAPDLLQGLKSGRVLPLGSSRYFLLEPPQGIVPPRFDDFVYGLIGAGYVPIITHPERMSWIESHYELLKRLVRSGVWVQLTAGSLLGRFGRRARTWAERMLEDGLIHIIASDAHDMEVRTPRLRDAFHAVEAISGRDEAIHQVLTRPTGILRNFGPSDLPEPRKAENPARRARDNS